MNNDKTQAIWDKRLLDAAKSNDLVKARRALRQGAKIDAANEQGQTAAILFAHRGNTEAVLALAKIDASVLTQADKDGYTPAIWLAADANQCVDGILKLAEINREVLTQANNSNDTPAILLAFSGNVKGVLALAELSPKVLNQQDDDDNTPALLLARERYDVELVALARQHPQVLNQRDRKGLTPVMHLVDRGNDFHVIELLEIDEDILFQTDYTGDNLVGIYMRRRNVKMIKTLARRSKTVINQPGVKDFLKTYDTSLSNRIRRMWSRN